MAYERTADWNADKDTREQVARDEETVRRDFWHKLRRVAGQIPFAEDLVTAYYCAMDRQTPLQVRAALLGALAYFILPFDVLPDAVLLLGFTDDAAILAGALKFLSQHIRPEHREAARRALEQDVPAAG